MKVGILEDCLADMQFDDGGKICGFGTSLMYINFDYQFILYTVTYLMKFW